MISGLSPSEAAARLATDGRNELPSPRKPSAVERFTRQLVHFFALMLWVASGLALIAGLPELAIAIGAVIVLNAVFAFVQEHRADRAAERLQGLLPRRITVRRGGRRIQIDAAEVVVGDVLVLESGDRIPADATVAAANAFRVDTSLLTGESEPLAVGIGDVVNAGTFVVEGDADAVTTATGGSTRLAEIARLTTSTVRPASPLTIELHGVVRTIGTYCGRHRRPVLHDRTAPRQSGRGRVRVRDRRHRRPRAGSAAADGHAVARVGSRADGQAARARAQPRRRGDTRLDDVHLHGQDRDADP